jgi:hypothetical protein
MTATGSHVFAYLVNPRMVAFADRVVIVSRFGRLGQFRLQAQFIERFGNHCGQVLIALLVDARAHGGVKRERICSPLNCAAATATRTGPQEDRNFSR